MPRSPVDIIIPSYNNLAILDRCLTSILHFTDWDYRITVVNNGQQQLSFAGMPDDQRHHQALSPGSNLKWTKAINYAGKKTEHEFVMMLNDDTQVLDHDKDWIKRLMKPFENKHVGAAGPISNYAMGYQSIMNIGFFPKEHRIFISPALSGFCMLVKRRHLDELGWLDEGFEDGSEDVDISIRLRMAGYDLAVCRDVYLYHMGSVTAEREYGGWWNSNEYSVDQRMKLLRKFGVKKYQEMMGRNELVALVEEEEVVPA